MGEAEGLEAVHLLTLLAAALRLESSYSQPGSRLVCCFCLVVLFGTVILSKVQYTSFKLASTQFHV